MVFGYGRGCGSCGVSRYGHTPPLYPGQNDVSAVIQSASRTYARFGSGTLMPCPEGMALDMTQECVKASDTCATGYTWFSPSNACVADADLRAAVKASNTCATGYTWFSPSNACVADADLRAAVRASNTVPVAAAGMSALTMIALAAGAYYLLAK